MKNIALIGVLLAFAGCAASPPVVNFLWQGKPGEAVRHFGSAEAAQLALDKDVDACSFEIRQTAAGEIEF